MPILPSPPNTASSSSSFALRIPIACYRDATATRQYLKQLENEPKEQLMDLLIYQNTEGESVGMTISRHQDAATTQQYLQLLKDALENGKLTSEQLTMLLTQQDKDGWSVGMFIVDEKDNARTQVYLQMLENVLENGKLTSEQFTRILTQQDKEGWSVGMMIACYRDATTTQAYLQLLKKAIENEQLTSEQFTRILMQQMKEGGSIGMIIAFHQDATIIQAYLQLLKNVLENGKLTSEQLTMLLMQEDKEGKSVGKIIAREQDATITQAYLQLLKRAIENEKLTSEQVTTLLTQQNENGWSVGMFIARHQDATTTQQYLQLLKDALENGKLTSEQLTTILVQQNKEGGGSVGMFIAHCQDATTTQAYLQLLEKMIENEKLTSEQVTTPLTQQNENGWSVGMGIARYRDAATTQAYLQFLEKMIENEKLTSEQLTRILTQQSKERGSVEMIITRCQDKATQQQYQDLKKILPFIKEIEEVSSLLECFQFEGSADKLKKLLLFKNDIGITGTHKISLNKKIRSLISDFNSEICDQKTAEFFGFLSNVPDTSLFYISALISQLNLWTLYSSALDTVSLKLNTLPKTSFGYKEGQFALATYYASLFSQTEKMFTANELLAFLTHAERCNHAMLDMGYKMLRNYLIEGNTETAQGATSSLTNSEPAPDIILKKVLKSLVLLVSDNPSALKTLEDVLNQHRKDNLLDFYLEKTLFNDSSKTSSVLKNISSFFKSLPLPLFHTNKSRKIQITLEQLQELESLIPPNQQHNDVKESIAALIVEFNKGNITKENLFEKLRNSINEGNPDYLFVERAMTSFASSASQ